MINPLIAHELGALLIIVLILSANANAKRREEWAGVVLPRIDYQQSSQLTGAKALVSVVLSNLTMAPKSESPPTKIPWQQRDF